MHELFGEELPGHNVIRSSLVEMGFSSQPIETIVNSYVATLRFVQEEEEFIAGRTKTCKQPAKKISSIQPSPEVNSNSNNLPLTACNSPAISLQYQVALDCTARIEFSDPVTQAGIEKLITLLELNADVFPKTS